MSGSWMCVQGSTAKPSSTRLRRSHTPCALAMGEMPVIGKKRGTEEGPSYKSPEELALKLGPQPPPQSTELVIITITMLTAILPAPKTTLTW